MTLIERELFVRMHTCLGQMIKLDPTLAVVRHLHDAMTATAFRDYSLAEMRLDEAEKLLGLSE